MLHSQRPGFKSFFTSKGLAINRAKNLQKPNLALNIVMIITNYVMIRKFGRAKKHDENLVIQYCFVMEGRPG